LVDDLHVLLGNARIEGPYVLVGHSLSGHYVRLYIDKYPDDVAGVVLVDCGHPERDARLLAALPPEKPEESAALKNLRRDLVEYARDPSRNREGVNVSESASQADATGGLGGLPLVVLTRGKPDWPPGLAPEIVSELEKIHLEMQGELCDLSSNSIQLVAAESGHFVQRDQPTLVADAIRRVIDTVRNGGALDRPPPEAPRSS
jgi:pimeloyl-ACP methyl ester carboxylesterase